MKTVIQYQCEKCNKIYAYKNEAIACEANHLNLSMDEYTEYRALQENARKTGYIVCTTKNEQTEKAFDDACQRLADFEKNIISKPDKKGDIACPT